MDRVTWLLVFVALGAVGARSYGNLDNLKLKLPVTLKLVNGHFQPVFGRELLSREVKNEIRAALARNSANSEKGGEFVPVSDQPSESEREGPQNLGENIRRSEPIETDKQSVGWSSSWNAKDDLRDLLKGKLSALETPIVEPDSTPKDAVHESKDAAPEDTPSPFENQQISTESYKTEGEAPSNLALPDEKPTQSESMSIEIDRIFRDSVTSQPSPNEGFTTTESMVTATENNQYVEEITKQPPSAESETKPPETGEEATKGPDTPDDQANGDVTPAGNERIEDVTNSPSTNEKPVEPANEAVTEQPTVAPSATSELLKIVKAIARKVTTLLNNSGKSEENPAGENAVSPKNPIDELMERLKPFYERVMQLLGKIKSEAKSTDISPSQPSDLFKPVWNLVDNLKNLLANNILPALGSESKDIPVSQEKPTEKLPQLIEKILQGLKRVVKSNSDTPNGISSKSLPPTIDDRLVVMQQTMQKILENIQQMSVKKPNGSSVGLLETLKNALGDDFGKFAKSAVSKLWAKMNGQNSPSATFTDPDKAVDIKKAIEDLKLQTEQYKKMFQHMYQNVADLLKQKPVPFIDSLSSAVSGLNNVLDGIVNKYNEENKKTEGDDQRPTPQKVIVEAIRRVVKSLYNSLENVTSSGSDNEALSIVRTITAIQGKLKDALEAITNTYSRLSPKIFKDTFLEVLSLKKTDTEQDAEKEDPYQLPGKIYKVVHDVMDENPDDENKKFFKYFTKLYKKVGYSLEEKPEEFIHLFVESVLQLSFKIPETIEKYIVRFYRMFKDIYATVSDKLKAGHTDDFLNVLNKLAMRLNYTLGKRSEKSFKKEFVRMWSEKFDNNYNDIYHYFSEKGTLDDQQEYAGRIYRKAKTVSLLSVDNYPDEGQQLNKLLEELIGSKYSDSEAKLNERFMKIYKQMHRDLKNTLDGYLPQYYALFVRTHDVVKKEELTANEEDFIRIFIVASRELFGNDGKLFYKNSKYFQPYFYRAWKLAVKENESNKVHDEVSQEADTAKNSTDKIGQLIDDLFDESLRITKDEYKRIFLKLYELFGSNFTDGLSKNINHFIKLYQDLAQAGDGSTGDLSQLLTRIFRIVFVEKSFNYIKGWKSLNEYVISYWQKHLRDIAATALHTSLLETLNKVRPLDHLASSLYYDKPFLLKLSNVRPFEATESLRQYLDVNRILVKNLGTQYQALPAEATYLFVRTYFGLRAVLGTVLDSNVNTIFSVYQIVYSPNDPTVLENRKEFVDILVKTALIQFGQNQAGPEVVPIIVRNFNEQWKNFLDHKSNINKIMSIISTNDFSTPQIVEPARRPPTLVVIRPAPTEPAPTEPAPTEPAPTEPAPIEPAPIEPAPMEPTPIEPAPTPILRPVIVNINYLQRIPTNLIPTVRYIATNYFPGHESKLYELTSEIIQNNIGILNQTPYEILRHLVAFYSQRFNSPGLVGYLPAILNYHSKILSRLNKKIDNVDELYGNLYRRLSDRLGEKLEQHSQKLHSIVKDIYKTVQGKLKKDDFIDTFVESYKKLKEIFGHKVEPTVQHFAPQFINFSNSMDHYEINKNINVTETNVECCTLPPTTTPVSVTDENSEEERTRTPTIPTTTTTTPTTPTTPTPSERTIPTEPITPEKPTEPEEPVTPTPTLPTVTTPEPEENKTESQNSGDVETGNDVYNVSKHTDHFHNTSEQVMKESQKFQDVFFDIFHILHDNDHDFDQHSEDLYDILKQINLLYEYKTMEDSSFKKFLVNDFNETYVTKSMGNRSDDFHVLRRVSDEYHHANLVDVINNKDIGSVPVQIISKLVEYGFDQICLAYASNELRDNIGLVFFNHHNNKTLADIWFGKLMELYGTCFIDFMKTGTGEENELYMKISNQDPNAQALFFRTWYVMLATEAAKLSDHGELKTIYPLLLETYSKLKQDNIYLDSSSADFIYIFTNFYRYFKNKDEDLSSPDEASDFVEKVTDIYTKVANSYRNNTTATSCDQPSAYTALLERFEAIYPKKLKDEQAKSNFKSFFDTFYKLYEGSRYNEDLFIDALTDPEPDIPSILKKSLVSLFKKGVLFNKTYDIYYRLYDLPWHSVEYLDVQKYFKESKLSKVFDHIMKELHNDYGHMYDYDLSFIRDFLTALHERFDITETNKKNYYEAFMRVFTQTISKKERLSKDDFLKRIQLELKDDDNGEENTAEYKEFSKLYDQLDIKTVSRDDFIKYSKKVKKELGDDWDIKSYEHGFQTAFSTGRKVEHPYPLEFWRAYDENYLKIKTDWRGLEYANAVNSLKSNPTQLNAFKSIFDALFKEKGQDAFYLADFIKNVIRRIDGLLHYDDFVEYFLDFFNTYTGSYNDVTGFTSAVEAFFKKSMNFYKFKFSVDSGETLYATYIEDCDDAEGHPIFFKGLLERQQRQNICNEHTENDTYTAKNIINYLDGLLKSKRVSRDKSRHT